MKEKLLGTIVALSIILLMPAWALAGAPRDETVVPSATTVSLRTNETIDSKQATNGQTFSAVVQRDVTGENGEVAIPKGSPAELAVAKSGGKTLLGLSSVTVNGARYMVASKAKTGSRASARTAARLRTLVEAHCLAQCWVQSQAEARGQRSGPLAARQRAALFRK